MVEEPPAPVIAVPVEPLAPLPPLEISFRNPIAVRVAFVVASLDEATRLDDPERAEPTE